MYYNQPKSLEPTEDGRDQQKRRTITHSVDDIVQMISNIRETISSLQKKLEPVINENIPISPGEVQSKQQPSPNSILYCKLEQAKTELISIDYWLRSMTEQIEL